MRRNCILWITALLLPVAARSGSSACVPTLAPNPPFVPPAPYDSLHHSDAFWYGTAELWTDIAVDGVWHITSNSDTGGGYVTKLVFWTKSFDWRKEGEPQLIVTARQTDHDSPSVSAAHAHAVFVTGKYPAMMTGIRIPSLGCWEITSHYRSSAVTFTVSVQQ